MCIEGVDFAALGARAAQPGRRAARRPQRTGRYVWARPWRPGEPAGGLAVDATLRAVATRRALLARAVDGPGGWRTGVVGAELDDLRAKVRLRPSVALVVFVLDASDSMGTDARMAAAKGAVLALLTRAYQQRHRVALVAFEGRRGAQLVLPPTTSLGLARERLAALPIGGATPLAAGLLRAWQLVRSEGQRDPQLRPLLVLISDGEANVPLRPGGSLANELSDLVATIRQAGVEAVVVDTRPHGSGTGDIDMRRLAGGLAAAYHHISELRAEHLVAAVQRGARGRSLTVRRCQTSSSCGRRR